MFEPQSWIKVRFNWITIFLLIFIFSSSFWVLNSQLRILFILLKKNIFEDLSTNLSAYSNPSYLTLLISLILYIYFNNFFGLFPYIFTSTRHLVITISLAFPLWLGHIVLAIKVQPWRIIRHLVPIGTPDILCPLIVIIELVSSIIRPFTLSIRLAANIIAGHLLLSLLANKLRLFSLLVFFRVFRLSILVILELAVALIQAYVFGVLSTLYINEVNSIKLDN